MKAYLLARVSTDEQKDALPAQTIRLKDYAQRQKYICRLFEIQESAYKGDRQEFREIVDKIETEEEKVIVVFDKIDRLTRDPTSREYIRLIKLYEVGAIELHFPSDNIYIHQYSPASDKMRLGLGTTMAQYYSATISDNVRRRQAQMLRDGIWTGAAPFGYKYTMRNGQKWIEVDPVSAAIVRYVFKTYATGLSSLLLLSRDLDATFNVKFRISRIEVMLKRPFYYGEMSVNGVLYKHNYEPLITRELFDKVQLVLHSYPAKPHRWAGLPFNYRGLISCAECGCRVTFERQKKYIYGHCTRKRYNHEAKYVNEDKLTAQFSKIIEAIRIPDNVLVDLLEHIRKAKTDNTNRVEYERYRIETEIKKYTTRLGRMYDDRLDGLISDEKYKEKYEDFIKSRDKLQGDLQQLELLDSNRLDNFAYLLKLANKAPELFKKADFQEKRRLLKMIGSNYVLAIDSLGWKYKKPFNLMASCNKNANWQG